MVLSKSMLYDYVPLGKIHSWASVLQQGLTGRLQMSDAYWVSGMDFICLCDIFISYNF